MSESGPRTHYRTCNLCEAMCGLAISVAGAEILSIRGDEADPLSRGHICPKAVALQDIHLDPDRLRHPVRRTAAGWERIGWDEAFDEVAERLGAIQRAHGNDAVAIYQGNPSVHNVGTTLGAPDFVRSLRTKHRYSATSVDQLPHQFAAHFMFGHQFLLPIPDLDRTDFLLMLGANPAQSNGSLMTAPDIKKRLQAIRERGGRFVLIDPRRTETADLADEHHFIRPGSDALLLLALIHTILGEGLGDPGHLAAITDGLETLAELARPWTPELAAAHTGIAADEIRRLARAFAASATAVCYGRIGVSVQPFGALCQWLINALNIITGNLDRAGGAMFTRPAFDTLRLISKGNYARWASRVRGLPEFGGELPVVTMAEDMLTAGAGQIRAFVTSAGNPVLSTPNGRQLEQALAGLEFMVSIDIYINETTRFANIILPPTSALEHDHYDVVFNTFAIRNTAKYSEALFEPAAGARHDWEIFQALASRLHPRAESGRSAREAHAPAALLERGLRAGPYPEVTLDALRAAPHGLDLGPLQPCLPGRLFTADHRIQLAPELLQADLARLRRTFDAGIPAEIRPSLQLIGRRQLRSNNSWMHNSQRLVRGAQRCTLLIHPADAAPLGLSDGALVRITSRVGSIEAPVELSDAIMPGVVSLPHGWGHDRPGVELQTARAHPGASINDLTDDLRIDALCGNAALNGLPVTLELVSLQ